MKKRIKLISIVSIFSALIIMLSLNTFITKKQNITKPEDLINISKLPESFINNYFDEYNKLEEKEKENLLIVISKEKINKKKYNAKKVIEGPNNKYYLIFEDEEKIKKAVSKLNEEDFILSIEENSEIKFFVDEANDKQDYNSWGIETMGIDDGIKLVSSVTTTDITVAILDTGCDIELFNKYYLGKIEETHNILDDDNSMYDNVGHGTHIAGTIAEATPKNVKIIPIKISDSMRILPTDIIAGIEYITYYEKADVINMSFGGYSYSESQYQAIQAAKEKNIITVAAAGNDNKIEPSYPASFDNTISISSVDADLNKSYFSNYGTNITFAAPGGEINSLMANYMSLSEGSDGDDDHETISGTSMATPHAASAIAILKSFNKNFTLDNIIELLKNNSKDLGNKGYDYYYGHGLINFKNVILCTEDIKICDNFNLFKINKASSMNVSKVKFTNYNYGSINNILASTISFEEIDGHNYQKELWELDDIIIEGYDPFSTERQLVTIKYLDLETTIEFKNPENYELGWEYILQDGKYYLNGYKDNNLRINKLYIPSKLNDITIDGIFASNEETSNIFYHSNDADYFVEIIIPESFSYLGDYAFAGLKNVMNINIKRNKIEVKANVFSNMPLLTTITGDITLSEDSHNVFKNSPFIKEFSFSESTSIIPTSAFEDCTLLDTIELPNNITIIDDYAFKNTSLSNIAFSNQLKEIGIESFKKAKLSNLTLPNSLEKIADHAFSENLINSIIIPRNVKEIGLAPFSNNYIEHISVDSENQYYDSRENSNTIIESSTNKIIQGSIKSVIPNSILTIGEESYSELNFPPEEQLLIEKSLLFTYLEIPDGVTTIEKNAFLNSYYLEKVVLPNSITSIDNTVFADETSGMASIYNKTTLWVHKNSYAYNFATTKERTYVIIEESSVAENIDGFAYTLKDENKTIYYPYEKYDNIKKLFYYYYDSWEEKVKYVEIPNYTISYQNGDSFRYGDKGVYLNFNIENGPQNVKIMKLVNIQKLTLENIKPINLLIGEKIFDKTTSTDNGFGISIDNGTLYFDDDSISFEELGDYTVKGYFISSNDNYNDIWDLDIPIHVINKRIIKKEVNITTKIKDGTTNVNPDTITLSGLDKTDYTVVSAKLDSPDYVGNDAKVTIKIKLNDDIYKEYAFTDDKQEVEWTTTMTVADLIIPEINLLINEPFDLYLYEEGCIRPYNTISFEEPGTYNIIGFYYDKYGNNEIENIPITIKVINKIYIDTWIEIPERQYDGTTNIDYSMITLKNLNKEQYNIISAELVSPEVAENNSVKIKIKLTDSTYKNYAFTGNKQEYEWYNPIKITKGIPKYDVPTNLKAELGQKLSDILLPEEFEWIDENIELKELGHKTYKARFIPADTHNYKIIEDIDIKVEVLEEIIKYTFSDYETIYDGKNHTININVDEENYDIKYSLDNKTYNLDELPNFKNVGEYTIYYKITKNNYDPIYGSNKLKIYGIESFDTTITLKNDIMILKNNSFSNLTKKIKVYSKTNNYQHYDKNNSLILTDTIKTGDKINININNLKDYKYSISILGDVNSDGKISSADYVKIRKHIMQAELIKNNIYIYASDINNDDKISSADYVKIRKYIMNGESL